MILHPASYGHNNFQFNSHLNADGTGNEANVHVSVSIDDRILDTAYRDVRDPYHLTQGGQLGRVHKNFTTLQIGGRIEAPDASQLASLADREREMLAAFDPALCLRDSPSTQGAYPFMFSDPTTDTVTYPSGIILLQYWMRPLNRPTLKEALLVPVGWHMYSFPGGWRAYGLALIAPDPRAYEQTEQTLVLTAGSPSGSVLNRGNVPGPLKATIVMSGAGASNFTITRSGVNFVVDLSSFAAGTVIVVFETSAPYGTGRSITRSGTSIFVKKTSDAASWLDVPVGTTTFSMTNTTGITSCTLGWYSARA